jgi:hypothetical protein
MSKYAKQWPNSPFRPSKDRDEAVLAAFRAAWREFELGYCSADAPENAALAWSTATGTAEWQLSETFPDPVAKSLAEAFALSAQAYFCRDYLADEAEHHG